MQGRKMNIRQKTISLFHPMLYTRPMIKKVREIYNNQRVIGVEIGVAEGINAYNILRVLNINKLFLVDSYKGVWNNSYYMAQKLLKPFNKKIIFINIDSAIATEHIPDNLHFVYLDGDHSYKQVISDFWNYFPKLKKGGVIGGHDFNSHGEGVVQFVMEIHRKYGNMLKQRVMIGG